MNYQDYITIEPDKRGGKPCIRGLRITVHDVLDYLASGMTEAEILQDFPDLTSQDIKACLAFAADRERKLLSELDRRMDAYRQYPQAGLSWHEIKASLEDRTGRRAK